MNKEQREELEFYFQNLSLEEMMMSEEEMKEMLPTFSKEEFEIYQEMLKKKFLEQFSKG